MEFLFGSLEHLLCLEHLFGYFYGNYLCKETIVGLLVWNCLETLVLEILV